MSNATVADVAKKRPVSVPSPEPEPEEKARKPMIVQIRGSQAWKEWAEAIAEKEGDNLAKLFDRAMRKFAKDGGYPDPPRR